MRRYWVDSSQVKEPFIKISGDSYKHIIDVCRMTLGSKFEILTSESRAYFVELVEVQRKIAKARILELRQIQDLKKPYIHLVVSLPKFRTLENVVEKAVELGVYDIHLVTSEYSFIKEKSELFEKKFPRWQKIVKSATQQSGRGTLMKIYPVGPLKKFFKTISLQDLHLFAYEGEGGPLLSQVLNSVSNENFENIWIYIGSEGGFSFDEVEQVKSLGLKTLSLGDQVLRVETAAVSLVSAVKFHFDLF